MEKKTKTVKIIQPEHFNDLFLLLDIVVPSKQDKYEPINAVNPDNNEPYPDDFYILNKNTKESFKKFRNQFLDYLNEHTDFKKDEWPRKNYLEVFISVSLTEKRGKEVDVDNLSKSVIDCMKGIVFEDDNQILSLYATKTIMRNNSLKGSLFVGVRSMQHSEDRHFKDFKFLYMEEDAD